MTLRIYNTNKLPPNDIVKPPSAVSCNDPGLFCASMRTVHVPRLRMWWRVFHLPRVQISQKKNDPGVSSNSERPFFVSQTTKIDPGFDSTQSTRPWILQLAPFGPLMVTDMYIHFWLDLEVITGALVLWILQAVKEYEVSQVVFIFFFISLHHGSKPMFVWLLDGFPLFHQYINELEPLDRINLSFRFFPCATSCFQKVILSRQSGCWLWNHTNSMNMNSRFFSCATSCFQKFTLRGQSDCWLWRRTNSMNMNFRFFPCATSCFQEIILSRQTGCWRRWLWKQFKFPIAREPRWNPWSICWTSSWLAEWDKDWTHCLKSR